MFCFLGFRARPVEHRDCHCTKNEEILNGKLHFCALCKTDKQRIRKVRFNKSLSFLFQFLGCIGFDLRKIAEVVKKVLVEAKKIATDAFNRAQEAIKNAQKSVSSAKTAVDGWNDGWSSYFRKPTKKRNSLV